jgi:hypothetical protein
MGFILAAAHQTAVAPLVYDTQQYGNDRQDKQDVDKPTQCERGNQTQQPENDQNNGNGV